MRELTVDDINDLYQIYQQPKIREFLDDFGDSLEVERDKHKAYIQNIYRFYGYGLWGVFFKKSGRLIGRCGIEFKMLDQEEVYELGYLLDTTYQGHGYAKEFVLEVLHYCFFELEIHRIIAVIDKKNLRSIHLAEQVGMQRVGECIRNYRDCYKYEITYHS
ncbi:MAG: GNAT family N-acetyltransferase [Herbinix sp.]|nr:GNAT family N-acetyltransferase [Herbinix sp.]